MGTRFIVRPQLEPYVVRWLGLVCARHTVFHKCFLIVLSPYSSVLLDYGTTSSYMHLQISAAAFRSLSPFLLSLTLSSKA